MILDIFSIKNLYQAYLKCRKGKRGKINTRGFEVDLYKNLQDLSFSLQNGTYQPKRSVCFYVTKPKLREVFASDFGDRVVHRLLVDLLEPIYEKSFISDSFACRKEKGTHKAIKRVKEFLKQGTNQSKLPFYYIQLDIKGFFMEIDKSILFNMLSQKQQIEIDYPEYSTSIKELYNKIIFHNPTKNFVYKGKIPPKNLLPPHKTLFHEDETRGMPIGNLTSQFFANVYLNHLDQFVKRNLGVKHYIRYMDDFLLFSRDPVQLYIWKTKIINYLNQKLHLVLKDEPKEPTSVYKGIDFLGYFLKPNYTLVRKRVIRNLKTALSESLPKPIKKTSDYDIIYFHKNFPMWQKLQSRINSYLGHIKLANSYHLKEHLKELLKPYFPIVDYTNTHIKLRPNLYFEYKRFSSQLSFYLKHFPDQLIVIQVGRYYELHGKDSEYLAKILKLKICKRRRIPYYGFPSYQLKKVLMIIKNLQISMVLIKQTEELTDKIKARIIKFYIQNTISQEREVQS